MRFLLALLAAGWLAATQGLTHGQELDRTVADRDTVAPSAAVVLDITGAIGPATSEYVAAAFADAAGRSAKLFVLRLDTPGGLDSSMRDIIRAVLDSPAPVITYVSPNGARAASAGAYLMYAGHIAAMAPSTHLGAATPVQLGGGFGRGEDKSGGDKKDAKPANAAEAKAVNDAVAYIRGLAELRGRNADWAEKAVREAATLTASAAKAEGVIDIIATDLPDLLRQLDGRRVRIGARDIVLSTAGMEVKTFEPDWRIHLLATITNPNIAYILMLVGIYGLLFEFMNPGAVFPGVIGGIALMVALYALNLLPVSYAGAGLLLLGVALVVAEAFVPSFGVLGIGGMTAFVFGSLLLFRGEVPGFQLAWPVVAAGAFASAAFAAIAIAVVWRAHRRPVVTGEAALIGSAGRVVRWADGEGEVQATGERWHAVSPGPLAPGQRVRIIERHGLILTVIPDPETSSLP